MFIFFRVGETRNNEIRDAVKDANSRVRNNRRGSIKLIYGSRRFLHRVRASRVPVKVIGTAGPTRHTHTHTYETLLTKGLLTLNPIINVISGNNMESTLVSVGPRPHSGIHSLTTA